jgi:hypothetical protein
MIRIAISQAAFDTIAATMPLASVAYEQRRAKSSIACASHADRWRWVLGAIVPNST